MTQNAAYPRREDARLYKPVDTRAPRGRVRRCDRERATRRRTSRGLLERTIDLPKTTLVDDS